MKAGVFMKKKNNVDSEESLADNNEVKSGKGRKAVRIICIVAICGALLFLLYYHLIQPYFSERTTDRYRDLYHDTTEDESASQEDTEQTQGETQDYDAEEYSDRFKALINYNADIRGWINIPGTNIDYPVVQAREDTTDYYLTHNVDGEVDKNGTLFIDYRTVLSKDSKSIVINGHNMKSTGLMFHELIDYKTFEFYQQNPVITFDTVYGDAQWKIISLIKTNNNESQGERFNFFKTDFTSDEDFMEYVYQLELRSLYNCPVTVNEDDQLLILSTCTWEMDDMRFLIVARKVRDGEDASVDTSQAEVKKAVLYPDAWYSKYGGERPEVSDFKTAYSNGQITWYDGTLFS